LFPEHAFLSFKTALEGFHVEKMHGVKINGKPTVEETGFK
jgi:hypothetical protein